jgi:hypothetical protein
MREADRESREQIRALASDPVRVTLARQSLSDLLAWKLTKLQLCDAIVAWIDAGRPVKQVVLHSYGGLRGRTAFELKPRLLDRLFYVKVTIFTMPHNPDSLLVISAHPDHPR